MKDNIDLGLITLTFITNAITSRDREDQHDCIFQLGQAKGMWFTLKMLGFDIEQIKEDVIKRASKLQVKDIIDMFEYLHKDVVNHVDQIIGGMLLNDAQRP